MPCRTMLCFALIFCCGLSSGLLAEDYDQRAAQTDMRNPDAVYELAMWCAQNNQQVRKSRLLKAVIKLNPDHYAARDAMGQVFYNNRWVHASRVPKSKATGKDSGKGSSSKRASSKAPSAQEIEWNLTLPQPTNPNIHNYLVGLANQMNTMDNHSGDMEVTWRTMLLPEYAEHAASALTAAMAEDSFTDLFGVSFLMIELFKGQGPNDRAMADQLFPFLVKVSERTTDDEELYFFGMVAGEIADKRVTPRLIEMLDQGGDAALGAAAGLSLITLIPEDQISASKAKQWWSKYHATSNSELYGDMLDSPDFAKRLNACYRLYDSQDARILPALITMLRSGDQHAFHGAVGLLERITGNDWSLNGVNATDPQVKNLVNRLEEWWKEDGATFTFVEFRGQSTTEGASAGPEIDRTAKRIVDLASPDSQLAREASDGLRRDGMDVVPQLIEALADGDAIRRMKARDILREITRQNFDLDPFASDSARSDAVAQWKAWLAAQSGE